MVRFNVTQTVWKNSEDEILKAAVMKYGLNQWGRVASLFAKRSARQCKARWDEWLDPNIKKTEWSREEDEKLLHLAKLMPTQWRTIAPLVGRTAAQCLERYERLLDAAAAGDEEHEEPDKEKDEFDEGGEDGEEGDGTSSSKKKKRIAAAETLPAKPDAQDMDEEELEMLSEAKARLANTLGKKAKRKARERQLEEQQRIAQLQKRRELKAAGVATGKFTVVDNRKRRRKNSDAEHIDYTTEVPFEQLAPKGPYDVLQEKLDSARRERDEKARIANLAVAHEAKKALEKKQAKKKSATLNVKDLEARLAAERRRNEEALAMARKARAPLSLPEPQVSDAELEEVAKASLNASGPFAVPPLPSNRKKDDVILQEARNQLARDGREDIQMEGEGTGWKTALPSTSSTSSGEAKRGLTSLASRRTFAGANGRVVVLRDELGINKEPMVEDDASVIGDAEEMAAGAVKGLHAALTSLPAPEYEYSIQVKKPKIGDKDDEDERDEQNNIPMDARERERKRLKTMEEKQRRLFNLMPTALKQNLPELPVGKTLAELVDSEKDFVRKMILKEMQLGSISGNAASVDMESFPELQEVANAQLNPSEIHWDKVYDGLVDYSSLENPLELFIALRKEVARVAKENEQIRTITNQVIQTDKERSESVVKETMSLFRKYKAALMGRDLSKWMKAKEDEAAEYRLEQIQKEVTSLSQTELELQRKWAERLA